MTIKNILLSLTFVLVVLVVGLAGSNFWSALQKYNNASFASKKIYVIDDLLDAAGNWAVERGVTNSALSFSKKVPDHMRDIIVERRKKGDEDYIDALEIIKNVEFEGKEGLLSKLQSDYENILAFRQEVDKNLGRSKIARSGKLIRGWVPAMSELIVSSQDLRFAIGEIFSAKDSLLSSQNLVKHFVWVMSEYAGRERAIIGGILASNNALSTKHYEILSNYRGRIETAWQIVQRELRTSHDKDVLLALKKAEEHYFGSFESVIESIYQAGIEGEEYSLTPKEWIAKSTAAIDSLLGIQSASIEKTHEYVDGLKSQSFAHLIISSGIMMAGILLGVISFVMILMRVLKPLSTITEAMNGLSDGDASIVVPALGRRDEIGEIAASVQIFKENAIEKERLEAQQIENEKRMEEEKREARNDLAQRFDAQVGGLINSLASASTELQSTAESMRNIADETSQASQIVASSTEEANSNVSTVASAMEEMSASSNEIASQITSARYKSNDTADNAQNANQTVENLDQLVENIGEVVIAIQDIAEQTNLLALNATIEAARAGEAGKGFAVVADEVKKLATETSQKTDEINSRITDIQLATKNSVSAMQRILANISEIDESVTGVSAAVEEQNAMNTEIVRSVSEASQGVQQVAKIIVEVQQSAGETGSSADSVLNAAREVTKLSNDLKSSVDQFLAQIHGG